jgi:thiamine biosynthesis lipoprotein ApbE
MPMALSVAVPMWMVRLSLMTKAERLKVAQADAMLIADHVDTLDQVRVMSLSQEVFSALARAIAFGALTGGIVDPFGRAWGVDDEAGTEPPGPESEPAGA